MNQPASVTELVQQARQLVHEKYGQACEPSNAASKKYPLVPVFADLEQEWDGRQESAHEQLLWRIGEPGMDITPVAAKLTAETGMHSTEQWAANGIRAGIKRYRDWQDYGKPSAHWACCYAAEQSLPTHSFTEQKNDSFEWLSAISY